MTRLIISRGSPFSNLVIIGEAPGAKEDSFGQPFVGRSGKVLDSLLIKAGINPQKEAYFCNVIKCRPLNNRKPKNSEVIRAKPWILQQIRIINPKLILLVGNTSFKAMTGINSGISIYRGKWIKNEKFYMMPIYHPSYLLRFAKDKIDSPYQVTLNDLINVKQKLSEF